MDETEIKELAEQHYVCVEYVCHEMYVDAFVHGVKHGQEDKSKVVKKTSVYERCKSYITDR